MAAAALQAPIRSATQAPRSFQFCGRSFLAFVLKPKIPIERWMEEADTWLLRSPGFFAGKPVVVDVSGLFLTKPTISELIADLGARGIRVMGMLGADPSLADLTLPPVLSAGDKTELAPKELALAKPEWTKAPTPLPALMIDTPVRSGQTIFHEGDVTVVGSVSSGAEIVATGSIHIYGTLRGRVLAGADGNGKAHIFCRRLEAELVAIDGYYSMAEDLSELFGKSIHAWLSGGELILKPFD